MSKVTDVQDENYSSESDNSRNKSRRRRGLHGKYKKPPRHQFVKLDLNRISLNGISLGDENEPVPTAGPSRANGALAESDNPSEPEIPYLEKGKWKATPEDEAEVENDEWDSVRRAQIQADYEAAVELENSLLLESQLEDESGRGRHEIRHNKRKHQTSKDLVEAENRQLRRQLEELRSTKKTHPRDDLKRPTVSATRSTRTLLEKGSVPPRATSRLPPQSSIHRAIFGDVGGGEPDSSSSSSSESSSSDSFTGRNLFRKEPGLDHGSDSSHTKQKKRDRRRKHRAKMTELKYQHAFLKNDPPFKYNGELQAGLFKKWVREVQDWIADGHLSEQQGI